MSTRRSPFAKPLVHQPPGVYEPFKLCLIRLLRASLGLLPDRWIRDNRRLASLSEKLELADWWRTDALAFRVLRARKMGMKVVERCRLYSLQIASEAELVEFGDDVIVSGEVMFVTHDGSIYTALDKFPDANGHYGRIRIGNGCFLGMRSTILPGVELGDNCVVAAGATVMDSFPANSVIAGNPATYVCSTSIYMELRRHSVATVYDPLYPFPLKMPPDLLVTRMANVPYKLPRRREKRGSASITPNPDFRGNGVAGLHRHDQVEETSK